MSKFALVLSSALLLLSPSLAAEPEHSTSPKVRSFAFEKVSNNALNVPRRPVDRRRAETVAQALENLDFLYYANVSLGTPAQPLRLHLDTGSSDIWVESASSDLCMSQGNPCASTGTFDRKKSSTYKRLSGDFQISYVDGEYANGDYGLDTFTFGDGKKVKGLQFGIGLEATSTEGIMGIGMSQNEVQVQRLGKEPYKNLVELMVEQDLISTKAYSLWLNSLDASSGEVLFGGIDRAKYTGDLKTLPISKRSAEDAPREFIVSLTGVGLTNEQDERLDLAGKDFLIPVLLDSGSTYTYLPGPVAKAVGEQVGAVAQGSSNVPIVPCDVADYKGTVDFEFSGQTIKVGLDQLTVKAFTNAGDPAEYSDGASLCYFGIMDSGDDTYVLGDTFLRSAYVVYDIEKEEIGLAQTKFDSSSSDVVEIGKGKTLQESVKESNSSKSASAAESPSSTSSQTSSSSGTDTSAHAASDSPSSAVRSVAGLRYDTVILGAAMTLTVMFSSFMV